MTDATTSKREEVAQIIREADNSFSYHASLSALVDGVATYTLRIGGDVHTFTDTDEASAYDQYTALIETERDLRRADAILAIATPVEGEVVWRTIDSAPRNGTRMCVAFDDCPDLPYHWEIGRFTSSKGWCNTYGHRFSGEPTHWMVPAPPPELSPTPVEGEATSTDDVERLREALADLVTMFDQYQDSDLSQQNAHIAFVGYQAKYDAWKRARALLKTEGGAA